MDYEQKYKDALDAARHIYDAMKSGGNFGGMEDLEVIFPELAESEDERIRKHLVAIVEMYWGKTNDPDKAKDLAYLEKQKDLISYYEEKLDRCACENLDKGIKEVLNHPEEYGLEKQKEQKPNYCHHEVDETGWTEEYRKAYYDGWNNCNMQHSQLKAEQKPAWSEDDKQMWMDIKCDLIHGSFLPFDKIEWLETRLKSLRPDSYKNCNSRWKPSEEQMEALLNAERLVRPYYPEHAKILAELYEQLKAL